MMIDKTNLFSYPSSSSPSAYGSYQAFQSQTSDEEKSPINQIGQVCRTDEDCKTSSWCCSSGHCVAGSTCFFGSKIPNDYCGNGYECLSRCCFHNMCVKFTACV